MESWRKVWREGVAPILSEQSLQVLKRALETDDPRLIQGATTSPPPLQCMLNESVNAACALGFAGWQGEELDSVEDVEEFFAKKCYEIDQQMNEPAACRWFLNWFDETPREEMRKQLLPEVIRALQERENLAPSA